MRKNWTAFVRQAVEIGKASALVQKTKVNLGPAVTSTGIYHTPVKIDPFDVSLEDKLAVLYKADAELAKEPGVKIRSSQVMFGKRTQVVCQQ